MMKHKLLEQFRFVSSYGVQWGEQDSFGHVNNLIYFRWAESARIEYLLQVGIWTPVQPLVTGPILAAIGCNFRMPVTYPDTVFVGTKVTKMGNSSFQMGHTIVSKELDRVVAEVDSTLVFYNYQEGRPTPLPADIREAIQGLESGKEIGK